MSRRHIFQAVARGYSSLLTQGTSRVNRRVLPDGLGRAIFNNAGPIQQQHRGNSYKRLFGSEPQSVLKEMNRTDPEGVVRAFESGGFPQTEANLAEYVKALVKLDRLDNNAMLRAVQRGSTRGAAVEYAPAGSGVSAATPMVAAASGGLGTSTNPIFTAQTEQTFKAQLWRTVRTLGAVFVVFSGIGALFESAPGGGGISRGIMGGQEPKPQAASKTKFSDVKGVDEAKAELEEVVEFLKDPKKFTTLGGKLPKGVLLVGPPGTGKTMLARAVAGEAGVPFFYASGSDFEEMFVGVGARRVRDLFSAAKKHSPCIIFLDEIDAIGGSRNPKDQMYMRMTLNQILVELDGFKSNEGVIVIAATNFFESLDKALVRPGRFDRTVAVNKPDVAGREQILEEHFKGVQKDKSVDLKVLARGTPGMSGADLSNLINVAAIKAARDGLKAVDMATMEWAKDRILMGNERKSAVISEENKKLTAYHEGGHALVALYTDGAMPVHKATIMPRGLALGMVQQLPGKDQTSVNRRELLARLDVCMGGRVAEELVFGDSEVTTGASQDLVQATSLARQMVTKYGFSNKVGYISTDYEANLSPEHKKLIEEETRLLCNEAYERAKAILTKHSSNLHLLAGQLITHETLSGAQIRKLLDTGALNIDEDKAMPSR
ncbi:ATP-dependent zinc metalloprotease FTSH 4, mitochondrial, variant 2 [Cymbomonas tetramitiformis]|uniref:ATP-dependent zinc metalloprotease FTSH 4, mitochondrial, variant 2 n=1 Tax=Cymbomonas tetramitiformis TaxID=36881 RepID=A0AAE0GSM5_9CHLO|nr:ATP-dependent zinc metalloprotease FTSH 4, mitochondrial, variant 2 [Cymbomonas tetramitiformis]